MRNKPTAWAEVVQRMCLRGIAKTISKNWPQNHYRSQYGTVHIFTWKGHKTEADGTLRRLKSFTLMPIIIYPKRNISHSYLISNLLKYLGYLLRLVVQAQTAGCSLRPNSQLPAQRELVAGWVACTRSPSWTAGKKIHTFLIQSPSTWYSNSWELSMVFVHCLVPAQFILYISFKNNF